MLVGTKLWYDLSHDSKYEKQMNSLIRDIRPLVLQQLPPQQQGVSGHMSRGLPSNSSTMSSSSSSAAAAAGGGPGVSNSNGGGGMASASVSSSSSTHPLAASRISNTGGSTVVTVVKPLLQTVDQVCEFVASHSELQDYAQAFREQEIDGECLQELHNCLKTNEPQFITLLETKFGVVKLRHALKFAAHLRGRFA